MCCHRPVFRRVDASPQVLAANHRTGYRADMSVIEIRNAAAALAERERAELAAWLLDSLPPHAGEDDEGLEETARRRDEFDSGKTLPLKAEKFWRAVDSDQK
jgi:hypothetical protein